MGFLFQANTPPLPAAQPQAPLATPTAPPAADQSEGDLAKSIQNRRRTCGSRRPGASHLNVASTLKTLLGE